jgi:hypothetical protein
MRETASATAEITCLNAEYKAQVSVHQTPWGIPVNYVLKSDSSTYKESK